MSSASFNTPSGGSVEQLILRITEGAQPTEGDALFTAQRQRTRILDRTLNGLDVDGNPFAPYSTNGPYYYYPNGRVGNNRFTRAQNKSAVSRLIKRIGVVESHTGKDFVFRKTRSGIGIRFESYAAFKAAIGRINVDLMGPRAPHMLQQLAIGVGFERVIGDDIGVSLTDRPQLAKQFVIGIYNDAADRASGHNNGIPGRLPQRRFIGASQTDIDAMLNDMVGRIIARIELAGTLQQ